MKPSEIFTILDLARSVRQNKGTFNPLFVGPPGLGKSQIVQQWAKTNNLPFVDLRAAYLEAPDVIGFPSIEDREGAKVTTHNTPEYLPRDIDSEGVLLLEEPNRGTTSVMNAFMQILTDRKIHNYTLPPKWLIVGCINPESSEYDVNTMDAALRDRFSTFTIEYDKNSFVDYMKTREWDKHLVLFVQSGCWTYADPEKISTSNGKYISPRTFSYLNDVLQCSLDITKTGDSVFELHLYQSILGNGVGKNFWAFKYDENPVLMDDLLNRKASSIKKLQKYSNPENVKNALISITIQDIIDSNTIELTLLGEVLLVLPVDQGTGLISALEFKRKDYTILETLCKTFPEVKLLFKEVLKHGKSK